MSPLHEEEALGKAYDARLARRLARYLRPYKSQVALALGLTLAVIPLEAVTPYLFGKAVDWAIVPALNHQISLQTGSTRLAQISLGFLAALVLGFTVAYLQIRVMQRVGQETMYDLRKEVFAHLQRLPMSFYDRSPVGRLVTRVTTDVDALNELFAAGFVTMINDVCLLACIIVLLLVLDWRLALAAFAVLPFIVLTTLLFRTQVRDANRRIRTAIARINAFLQEHISGMSVVQLFNGERRARADF